MQSTSNKSITSNDLYDYADRAGIEVDSFPLPLNKSVSVMDEDGNCYIGLDVSFDTSAEELVHIAHELGHCERGAFYNMYSAYDVREKYERQADEWAIKKLVPWGKLKKALRSGITEPWQVAEEFNITDKFAVKVMEFYLKG